MALHTLQKKAEAMTVSFPKSERWDESRKLVVFPADVDGHRIGCAIWGETLVDYFGAKDIRDVPHEAW